MVFGCKCSEGIDRGIVGKIGDDVGMRNGLVFDTLMCYRMYIGDRGVQ